MSLRNRNETKLLVENWRLVLNEGLYDEDIDEVLEEGWKTEFAKKVAPAFLAGSMSIASTVKNAFATPDDISPSVAKTLSDMSKGVYSPEDLEDKKAIKFAAAGLLLTALQELRKERMSASDSKDFDAIARDAKKHIVLDLYYKLFDLSYKSTKSFDNIEFNRLMSEIKKMAAEGNDAADFLIKVDEACGSIAQDLLLHSKSSSDVFDLAASAADKIKNTRFKSSFTSTGSEFLEGAKKIADFLQSQS